MSPKPLEARFWLAILATAMALDVPHIPDESAVQVALQKERGIRLFGGELPHRHPLPLTTPAYAMPLPKHQLAHTVGDIQSAL